jgi:predicted Zn-dependent protease
MPQVYDSSSVPKKRPRPKTAPGYKPVRVYRTPRAAAKNIPVQRAVTAINSAAKTRLARTTKNRKKADVVVTTSQAPKAKKLYQGHSDRIPKSRKQMDNPFSPTKVRVQPSAAKASPEWKKAYNAGPGDVPARVNVTAHELGHSLGLTHHEKQVRNRLRKNKADGGRRTLPSSIMSGGKGFSKIDVRRMKKVTGYTAAKKARKRIPREKRA